jgi:uncharacterized DUF497 family protein
MLLALRVINSDILECFTVAQYLDWTKEVVWQDVRYSYDEVRMSGLVPLEGKDYAVVYVVRAEFTRMISLRKANKREAKHYEKNQ